MVPKPAVFPPIIRSELIGSSPVFDFEGRIAVTTTYNTLILGASYGSLLAIKLLLAGHRVKLVCLPDEAKLINKQGTRVRMPAKARDGLVEIDSRQLPGTLSAATPDAVDPAEFDLIALAMQEPQYRAPAIRKLLDAVATSRVPCMSIMNMPPPALPCTHTGPRYRCAERLLHRPDGVGQLRPCIDDALQSGPPALSPAGRRDECAAGQPADQFQGGPVRFG